MTIGNMRRVVLASALGAFFFATSQDTHATRNGHDHSMGVVAPVCSDKPVEESTQRMNAIQSLRETQIEVEMMKRHQAASDAK